MDSKQWNYVSLAIVLALVVTSIFLVWPPATKIRQGLDIKGGLEVILTAEGGKVDAQTIDRALTIVQARVDGLGVSEATVQKESDDAILVQLPGVKDTAEALKVLGSTGQLEFVEVASLPTTVQADITASQNNDKPYFLEEGTYKAALTGEVISNAAAGASAADDAATAGTYEVNMSFDGKGTDAWREITSRNLQKQVAIVLDRKVVSAPVVQSVIPDGQSVITGSFTADEAKSLAAILQSGALPVSLKYSDTNVVGPTLGRQSLMQGLYAAIAGLILVAIYLGIYYRGLGILAWFSLGFFLIIYLGLLATLSAAGVFALSLPGIAGLVLSVSLAADTSVLIFERLREEMEMGKTARSAAKSGTKHALLTSIDADVVTMVSAIVISLVAVGPVRGFANTLMMGLVIDLTVAWLFTRPMVLILAESVIPKHPVFFGVKGGDARA